jgi:hypothetical protein
LKIAPSKGQGVSCSVLVLLLCLDAICKGKRNITCIFCSIYLALQVTFALYEKFQRETLFCKGVSLTESMVLGTVTKP